MKVLRVACQMRGENGVYQDGYALYASKDDAEAHFKRQMHSLLCGRNGQGYVYPTQIAWGDIVKADVVQIDDMHYLAALVKFENAVLAFAAVGDDLHQTVSELVIVGAGVAQIDGHLNNFSKSDMKRIGALHDDACRQPAHRFASTGKSHLRLVR